MLTNYPSVAVVILNWNGKHWLQQFLPSVMQHQCPNLSIVVGDNASTDDSISFLEINYPTIKILKNDCNLGFAGGYQQILNRVQADYYILLNSDVEVTENWIMPVIEYMESYQNMAAAQPKVNSFYKKNSFEYAGAAGGFIDKNGFLFCRGRIFDTIEDDIHQYDDNAEIFWATGACLFVKAKAFHQVGGLDELFFAHQEEVDLCWRLRNAGYTIGYCSASQVYHVGGGMLPQGNPKKTYLNFRNSLFLLFKNLPWQRLPYIFIKRTLIDAIAACKALTAGKYKDAWAVIKAHYMFYFLLPSLIYTKYKMKKMKVFHHDSFYPNQTGYYNKSVVWEYFINKKRKFSELIK
jgi:GT2 family glycosyltransferase